MTLIICFEITNDNGLFLQKISPNYFIYYYVIILFEIQFINQLNDGKIYEKKYF